MVSLKIGMCVSISAGTKTDFAPKFPVYVGNRNRVLHVCFGRAEGNLCFRCGQARRNSGADADDDALACAAARAGAGAEFRATNTPWCSCCCQLPTPFFFSRACWSMRDWSNFEHFVGFTDRTLPEGAYLRAVVALRKDELDRCER